MPPSPTRAPARSSNHASMAASPDQNIGAGTANWYDSTGNIVLLQQLLPSGEAHRPTRHWLSAVRGSFGSPTPLGTPVLAAHFVDTSGFDRGVAIIGEGPTTEHASEDGQTQSRECDGAGQAHPACRLRVALTAGTQRLAGREELIRFVADACLTRRRRSNDRAGPAHGPASGRSCRRLDAGWHQRRRSPAGIEVRSRPARSRPASRDGLTVLRALRGRHDATPVIILTARDDISDRIAGLDAGADDYVVKPFDLDELAARIRSVTRRAAGRGDPCIEHAGVRLDPVTRSVEKDGTPVHLSAHEFAVLEALMQRPGAVLASATRRPPLWLARLRREQCRRGLYPRAASQAGSGRHQDPAWRGILPAQMTVSIRARLLITLLALATSVSLLAGVLTYRQVLAESSTLFDYQLRQMALSLRNQVTLAPRIEVPPDQGDADFVVQIWDLFGARAYRSRPGLPAIERPALGYADLQFQGQTWRSYGAADAGWVHPGSSAGARAGSVGALQRHSRHHSSVTARSDPGDRDRVGGSYWFAAAEESGYRSSAARREHALRRSTRPTCPRKSRRSRRS